MLLFLVLIAMLAGGAMLYLSHKREKERLAEEAEAAMAQVDPTNYTALGEQQAKIDEAHAAMDELEMAWLEASEKLEGEE